LQWKIKYWKSKYRIEGVDDEKNDEADESEPESEVHGFVDTFASIPRQEFICLLTREVMEDPVMTRNGLNFDRKAILTYLDNNDCTCPVTGKPLRPSGLVSNGKLKWEIEQWRLTYGDSTDMLSKLEMESKLSKAEMVSRNFNLNDILRALSHDRVLPVNTDEEVADPGVASRPKKPDFLALLDDTIDTLDDLF
jgi:hypothetical protein